MGKTKRDLETRVKEHFRNIKNGEIEKSAVAAYVWKEKHAMDRNPVLTKNKQELTNWVNILITKNKDRIINFEIPPADHLTRKFTSNPVEGSRSAPTRIQTKVSRSWVDNEEKFFKSSPHIFK